MVKFTRQPNRQQYTTNFGSTPQNYQIVGTRKQVRYELEKTHNDGRLVAFAEPEPIIVVEVEAYPINHGTEIYRTRDWMPVIVLALGLGLTALAVVIVYMLVVAIIAMIAWVAANWVIIVVTLVSLLVLLLWIGSKASGCTGIHCGGCKG